MMKGTPVIPVEEWEWLWAPYDAPTYQLVLDQIGEEDIVLEIGAGDLRLSRQMAERAKWVYALEQNLSLLERSSHHLPANVKIIAGDARTLLLSADITTAVLLMRHCTHFSMYFDKLRAGACQRLITNARWGMNVETINLKEPRRAYQAFEIGWYGCRCGNRGFKQGPPEALTDTIAGQFWELDSCPLCTASSPAKSSQFSQEIFSSIEGLPW
jgi:hypothetical protein